MFPEKSYKNFTHQVSFYKKHYFPKINTCLFNFTMIIVYYKHLKNCMKSICNYSII